MSVGSPKYRRRLQGGHSKNIPPECEGVEVDRGERRRKAGGGDGAVCGGGRSAAADDRVERVDTTEIANVAVERFSYVEAMVSSQTLLSTAKESTYSPVPIYNHRYYRREHA